MAAEKVILLVDNDPHDLFLMRRALQEAGLTHRLPAVHDGEEAIDYLRGQGGYANRHNYPLPCLILTDLSMPRMDGFEFLNWLRHQDNLKHIPALAISGSCIESDMQRAILLGAQKYFIKPTIFEDMLKLAREIKADWIEPHCAAQTQPAGPARPNP